MDYVKCAYEKHLCGAKKGFKVWGNICKQNNISDQDYIVVLSENDRINNVILSRIDLIKEQYKVNRLFLCVGEKKTYISSRSYAVNYIVLSQEEMEILCTFYRLYKFSDRIIFSDSEKVAEVDPLWLVKWNILSFEDIVERGVLGITGKKSTQTRDPVASFEGAIDEVERGYKIYTNILKRVNNKYIFYNNRATGNTLLMGMYIDAYVKFSGICDFMVVNTRKSSNKLCEVMGINSLFIDFQCCEKRAFERFVFFMHESELRLKTLNPYNHHTNLITMRGYKGLDMHTMYRCLLYRCDAQKPIKGLLINNSDHLFSKYNLRVGHTIVISPSSYSLYGVEKDFWQDLIISLKSFGYDICINIGEGEYNSYDAVSVFVPYDELIDFVNKAGFFIGVRSGLCDLVAQTSAKMFVIYNTLPEFMDYFSLERMNFKSERIQESLLKDREIIKNEIERFILNEEC